MTQSTDVVVQQVDGTTTTGDSFGVVMEDTEGYEVGQTYSIQFGPTQG